MDNKVFKSIFDKLARKYDFLPAFNAWFKESDECIIGLKLQKSGYANYYQLDLKIFIHGMFNRVYTKTKDLMREFPDILSGESKEYRLFFNLEETLNDEEREMGLENFFKKEIVPMTDQALSRAGIKQLHENKEIFLMPAVIEELQRTAKEGCPWKKS